MAEIGVGTKFYFETTPAGGSYTELADIVAIVPPDRTLGTTATTTFAATNKYKTFMGTMIEGGDAEVTIQYDPESSVNATLNTILTTTTARLYKIVYPGGGNKIFSAVMINIGDEIPMDDVLRRTLKFKSSGAHTEATA